MGDIDLSADQFIMLFSADWFRPYWHVLGIKIRETEAGAFQAAMRAEVSEMIGQDTEYYLISFEETRAAATRARLVGALEKYAEPSSKLDLINLHHLSRHERRAIQGPMLLEHYEDWERIKRVPMDISEWDRWLQSLTPGIPDALLCFALETAGL